jgi:hypothetical protein
MNSDLDSTQILTQHCGAKSKTVSQLMNSGTVPTRQVPVVQPLRVTETPADGVVRMSHHLMTTRTELLGFIKLSVQNKAVHMELSLRLSF